MSDDRVDGERVKLGLALSGGGLRAALFHLGVLRRMVELDLLRRVQVLSCVSGGSIIGALYALHLKKALEASHSGSLSQRQYAQLVDSVQLELIAAAKKNLRNALFSNPLGTARVVLTRFTLGERMGELYERHLFADVVDGLLGARTRGRIKLGDIAIRFQSSETTRRVLRGIDEYNAAEDRAGGSVLTKLVLNATSINSGARFFFSASEIGERDLGYIRRDESKQLAQLKRSLRRMEPGDDRGGRFVSLARWLRARGDHEAEHGDLGDWKPLLDGAGRIGVLADAKIGQLREAKIAAWYLRRGLNEDEPKTGGLTRDEHRQLFWSAIERIHKTLRIELEALTRSDARMFDLLLDFVLDTYLLRTADYAADSIHEDWEALTVGGAVAASACFPPLFAPIPYDGIYDARHVMRLGLTDGGVFDNIGVIGLLDESCNYIIASDAGRDTKHQKTASASRLGLGARLAAMTLKNLEDTQHRLLREREAHAGTDGPRALRGLAYFEIGSAAVPQALELPFDVNGVAALRTDLDGFGDTEIAALVNTGYVIADRSIRDELHGLAGEPEWASPTQLPMPMSDRGKTNRVLRLGRRRFYRSLRMPHPLAVVSWVVSGLVLVALGLLAWGAVRAWRRLADGVDLVETLRGLPDWVWLAAGMTAIAFLALRLVFRRKRRALRVLEAIRRGVLGLLLFPFFLVLVIGLTLYAWINHWCFHRPWLCMTRIREGTAEGGWQAS